MLIDISRFVIFAVVRRNYKSKEITNESIKRALRHNNANKTMGDGTFFKVGGTSAH